MRKATPSAYDRRAAEIIARNHAAMAELGVHIAPPPEATLPMDDGLVYFVEAASVGMIKIGYAVDVDQRFVRLQTGSPVPLKLLGTMTGGRAREAELHAQLAAYRCHGEWFRRHSEWTGIMESMIPWGMDEAAAS